MAGSSVESLALRGLSSHGLEHQSQFLPSIRNVRELSKGGGGCIGRVALSLETSPAVVCVLWRLLLNKHGFTDLNKQITPCVHCLIRKLLPLIVKKKHRLFENHKRKDILITDFRVKWNIYRQWRCMHI